MFRSTNHFKYSCPIFDRCCPGNGKGRTHVTNLSFKKLQVGKILALKTMSDMVQKMPKAFKENVVVSLLRRQNQHRFSRPVATVSQYSFALNGRHPTHP